MKSLTRLIFPIMLLVAFGGSPSLADGMPITNGRFEGKVSVLNLTWHQRRTLTDENRNLVLTKKQKKILLTEAGVAPSKLFIYFTKDGENDCTCFAFNLGLLFRRGVIEVPHKYLVPDAEAEARQKELDEM